MMTEGAVLLRRAALPFEDRLLVALNEVTTISPFRRMMTPGGYTMSVAMTNCGAAGWVTDRTGYRYDPEDPETGKPWPPMPDCYLKLAMEAATAGYPEFRPDACLVNRYEPGARLSLHQDKNERDFANPIVSVSLGLPATPVRRPKAQRSGEENSSHGMAMSPFGAAPPAFAITGCHS